MSADKDIVITGMSGRFPMSDNIDEFAKNLFDGIDMVSEDDSRWPLDLYGICPRMGKVRNVDKFDGFFFGLMQQLVDEIDPQSRILLETTYEAIVDSGNVEYAIVGGTHMTFEPFLNQIGQEVSLCSPRGVSAVLDQNADGFVKADGVACLLLTHRQRARRVYATALASRLNIDGKKTKGMFFPASESQQDLMVMAYKEAGVDPLKVNLIEAHCTGTRAGDPQEVKAIYNAYCALPGRTEPLPLGLLKSNIGHTEGCSGIAAIIKVLIAFENECIPPNLNLKQIKDECKQYCPPLYPNTEKLPYTPGIAGINNFGIGGLNGHVLIECNHKVQDDGAFRIAETVPRIINVCARTEEGIKYIMDFIQNNPQKISREFLALLTDTMRVEPSVNSAGFPYRENLKTSMGTVPGFGRTMACNGCSFDANQDIRR
ncbi:unnamed protein product [Medioppia subpectinata]|uniref:Ketosynthase family 3 (KS3) domain-containing protein n=1 Tax=Medioppia subpectinata TaxID=1979941 RepID=A0A7R9L0A6_9ACAR|nr:unnamed protein product [Medioppia subpectinata]CAG2113097.1 unnamed protein product [Medioppia subpectinata]